MQNTNVIYNVEGKKRWQPDPNISKEDLETMRVE